MALRLSPVEPENGENVLLLHWGEVVDLAGDFSVDVASVDHQHPAPVLRGLAPSQKLQLAGNRPGALNEHPARAAGWIKHRSMIRIKNMGNQGYERDRREELSAIVGLLVCKLGEKILVDPAEDIP